MTAGDGRPVRGALVRVSRVRDDFHEARTDADGRATLPDGSGLLSRLDLLVRMRGYLTRSKSKGLMSDVERIELVPGTPIRGRVVDERSGKPIAGAHVFAWDPLSHDELDFDPDQEFPGLVTDTNGRFQLSAVPNGRGGLLGVLHWTHSPSGGGRARATARRVSLFRRS